MSKFESDYKLWIKLRNMEEYKYHDFFRIFVQRLEHMLWNDCFPEDKDNGL